MRTKKIFPEYEMYEMPDGNDNTVTCIETHVRAESEGEHYFIGVKNCWSLSKDSTVSIHQIIEKFLREVYLVILQKEIIAANMKDKVDKDGIPYIKKDDYNIPEIDRVSYMGDNYYGSIWDRNSWKQSLTVKKVDWQDIENDGTEVN